LRVACGSMRLRYVNSKQTGHWPTVMTDIVSLHKHGSIDLQARCSKQIAEDPLVPPLGGVQKSDALRQSDTLPKSFGISQYSLGEQIDAQFPSAISSNVLPPYAMIV